MNLYLTLQAFIVLFIIVDPFGNIPIFISITENMSVKERLKVFNTASITAFLILFISSIFGNSILQLFNVSIDDFRIAGGLLLFVIAVNLLFKGSKQFDQAHLEDIGAVPLGCPLLAGPGAITTAIVGIGLYGIAEMLAALLLCFFVTWITLYFSENIGRFFGKAGTLILVKVMAILIATISVSFVTAGIKNIFLR